MSTGERKRPPLVEKFPQQPVNLFSSARSILFRKACATIVFRWVFVGTKLLKDSSYHYQIDANEDRYGRFFDK